MNTMVLIGAHVLLGAITNHKLTHPATMLARQRPKAIVFANTVIIYPFSYCIFRVFHVLHTCGRLL